MKTAWNHKYFFKTNWYDIARQEDLDKTELNSKFAYWRTIKPKRKNWKLKEEYQTKEYWPRNIFYMRRCFSNLRIYLFKQRNLSWMCYFLQETFCTQRIFTKPNYTIPFYFSRDDETNLYEDEKESLEGFITEEECLGALKKPRALMVYQLNFITRTFGSTFRPTS